MRVCMLSLKVRKMFAKQAIKIREFFEVFLCLYRKALWQFVFAEL